MLIFFPINNSSRVFSELIFNAAQSESITNQPWQHGNQEE